MAKKSASAVIAALTRVRVLIRGLPPGLLYQSKGRMEWEAEQAEKKSAKKLTHEDEARLLCHWMTDGGKKVPCLPTVNLYKSLCRAASGHKVGKKSAVSLVSSTVSFEQISYPLIGDYETYVSWVRIPPRTGSMVQIGRPLFRTWECELIMLIDEDEYNTSKAGAEEQIRPMLRDAGKLVGIGANRPELKGPHGKFVIVDYERLD